MENKENILSISIHTSPPRLKYAENPVDTLFSKSGREFSIYHYLKPFKKWRGDLTFPYIAKLFYPNIINFIFVGLLFSIGFVKAQTNVKSGDIRACDVWNFPNQLSNATIISGTIIQSSSTNTSATSITFQDNGAVQLNGNNQIVLGSPTNASFCLSGTLANSSYTGGYNTYNTLYASLDGASQISNVSVRLSGLPVGGATVKVTATVSIRPGSTQSYFGCWINVLQKRDYFYVLKNGVQVGGAATATWEEFYSPSQPNKITTLEVYVPVVNGDVLAIGEKIYAIAGLCGKSSFSISGLLYNNTTSITVTPGYF